MAFPANSTEKGAHLTSQGQKTRESTTTNAPKMLWNLDGFVSPWPKEHTDASHLHDEQGHQELLKQHNGEHNDHSVNEMT